MNTLRAHAKINWSLRVLGLRDDGFHEIQSLMSRLELHDDLQIEHAAHDIELVTKAPIPTEENLVYRAAMLLKERASVKSGARITLVKRIPLAAGLGGGSADAAAALVGLSKLWGLPCDTLAPLAASLGSDVPFFLGSPCALAEGRGERLTSMPLWRARHLLLLKPLLGVSSAAAYKGVKGYSEPQGDAFDLVKAIEDDDPAAMRMFLHNDLEGPVFALHPELRGLKAELMEAGALFSAMSGSGSTVFGVFGSEVTARAADAVFSGREGLWTCATRTVAAIDLPRQH